MKKIWKVLGIGAAAASLIPYAAKTNEETGEKTLSALLWRLTRRPDEENEGRERIELDLGPRFLHARKEEEMFADDEPEAALIEAEEAQAVADDLRAAADKAQDIADDLKEAAEEAQKAAAPETEAEVEAGPDDFAPEV